MDHPRIRGEHAWPTFPSSDRNGSSPHTRGAPRVESRRGILGGIIPAYAGSTVGGNTADRVIQGSSPHTRGAPSRGSHTSAWTGIIPAYAGSTNLPTAGDDKAADHPRIRGEHCFAAIDGSGVEGSSPHTRGAPLGGVQMGVLRRIIPAYAGSTRFWQFLAVRSRDHPRIRGEHFQLGADQRCQLRIIPAYAGSTESFPYTLTVLADHPRIRGEHSGKRRRPRLLLGSSPHTRGARRRARHGRYRPGIIPAYAGSTRQHGAREHFVRDHPRIRGEHEEPSTDSQSEAGSSPHTRGALQSCR